MEQAMNCRLQSDDGRAPSSDRQRVTRLPHHASRITFHVSRFTPHAPRPSPRAAFSLLEVMIAGGIFFMAIFAILGMVSGILSNARSLRRVELDAGMVAAQLSITNKLTEGTQSGDFGNLYPGYSWEADEYEVGTNGLWQVDIVVHRSGLQKPADVMSVWLFRPES
jgi:hypothetical protein